MGSFQTSVWSTIQTSPVISTPEKLDRMVQYESGLELEVLTLLERSELITYYQEQPAVIPYTFRGRNRLYYPDLFVATADGRGLLIEIKPTDRMAF
ncbi:hypothetical protein LNP25_23985 [Klebsiella variicola subsp. variicola]|nr:hypothetical protein [Klebsiella variicola subsp. variicola]